MQTATGIVSPHDQKVTFVELFFDLVFVFSVTQVVGFFHDGITWGVVGEAVLAFWLIWWGWTQFTWALNAADTTHRSVGLATLGATAVAFFMAVTLPMAFEGGALWFAISYVAVRTIGLAIYSAVARAADPGQHRAVMRFAIASIAGLIAVLAGGVVGGDAVYWFWGLAIGLDFLAALIGARSEDWDIHPEHFGERHGLFVIIALGETLIVAAAGVSGAAWDAALVKTGLLAVATTCALWWCYFPWAKPALDDALEGREGAARSELARDAYSFLHFPMVLGVICYAAAIEHAVSHPHEALDLAGKLALSGGIVLFLGSMLLTHLRAGVPPSTARPILLGVLAAGVLLTPAASPAPTLGVAAFAVALVAVLEERRAGALSFRA